MPEEETIEVFKPSQEFSSKAHVKNLDEYNKLYQESTENPEEFWAKMAEEHVSWYKKWDKVRDYDFKEAKIKCHI